MSAGVEKAKFTQSSINEIIVNVENVLNQIQSLSDAASQQAASLEEMSASMNGINNSISQGAKISTQINDSMKNQTKSFNRISGTAHKLESMADRLDELVNKFKV